MTHHTAPETTDTHQPATDAAREFASPEALHAFAKFIMEGVWQGTSGADGGSMQDEASQLGLLLKEPYDPEKHGGNDHHAEPGDDWFTLKPLASASSAGVTVSDEMADAFDNEVCGGGMGNEYTTEDIKAGLRAALSAAPKAGDGVQGWQPISTAPKDREILISGGTYSWDSGWGSDTAFSGVATVTFVEGRWQGASDDSHDSWYWYKPAVWQDLPPQFASPKIDKPNAPEASWESDAIRQISREIGLRFQFQEFGRYNRDGEWECSGTQISRFEEACANAARAILARRPSPSVEVTLHCLRAMTLWAETIYEAGASRSEMKELDYDIGRAEAEIVRLEATLRAALSPEVK
jgi:hypothetical protein